MSHATSSTQGPRAVPDGSGAPAVYDLLGVGFGPANMALAVLLEEMAEASGDDGGRTNRPN